MNAMIRPAALGRATLSPCGRYRYTLERRWADNPRYVLFLMLNPSTADAEKNDATIRRCLGYAHLWGYTGILVGNLYAYRATDPRELDRQAAAGVDVIGPDNRHHLMMLIGRASLVVCAWGRTGPLGRASFEAMQLLRPPVVPHYLKLNANQCPAHPLRLAGGLRPIAWDFFTRAGSPGDGS